MADQQAGSDPLACMLKAVADFEADPDTAFDLTDLTEHQCMRLLLDGNLEDVQFERDRYPNVPWAAWRRATPHRVGYGTTKEQATLHMIEGELDD